LTGDDDLNEENRESPASTAEAVMPNRLHPQGLGIVRQRPGMYIGSIDQWGLHAMIYTLVYNSTDEVVVGAADQIEVRLCADGGVMVRDNGRGIPVHGPSQMQKSVLERVMTELSASRRFDLGGYQYKTGWGGPAGSAPIVNALSTWLRVEVRYGGDIYAQEYKMGVPTAPLQVIGRDPEGRGTTTSFLADATIFQTTEYDYDVLAQRFQELCYLLPGLTIHLVDQRAGQERQSRFYFADGMQTWLRELNRGRRGLHAPFYAVGTHGQTQVEVALQYTPGPADVIRTFANNFETSEGGAHLTGLQAALVREITAQARQQGRLAAEDPPLTEADVQAGLTGILSVWVIDPRSAGVTTRTLANEAIYQDVQAVVGPRLGKFLADHPVEATRIVEHCLDARSRPQP
jgi:DNA gyrase subunit B